MRDYWTDRSERRWRVTPPGRRLNFTNPGAMALRVHVYDRDGFTCVKCGWMPERLPERYTGQYTVIGADVNGKRRELQLDHITALSKGGTNHPDNLQTLCFGCNAGKSDR